MSKIKLVAEKGGPEADKRVSVWIEPSPESPDKLRILVHHCGIDKPKCIGRIYPQVINNDRLVVEIYSPSLLDGPRPDISVRMTTDIGKD